MISLGEVRRIHAAHGVTGLLTLGQYLAVRTATLIRGPGVECTVCGWRGRAFRPVALYADRYVRGSAVCVACGAQERHRACGPFYRRFFSELPIAAPTVLHFAPERCFRELLESVSGRYLRSNYESPAPDELQLDLHDLALEDASIDVAILNYVLACTPDHERAVAGLARVVRPGGAVLACEPCAVGAPSREWGARGHGGQWRTYGTADLAARFAPFEAEAVELTAGRTPEEMRRHGLRGPELMLVLRRPPSA